ncbi:hypothetical protein B9Z55_001375 [Caenorhabditis nigoni]|uniref:Uncharacterized protein n=1 Tax=Caenorhabditis nigoni TaxID=1611254 RepID=A0A2G5VFN0_9PELO|nr:hypothetical protein B9Z55_001375 [Caenorhabditis nigoni]
MTEVAKQNEKFRMSLERKYQVAVVMSELCELYFCDFFLLCFFHSSAILRDVVGLLEAEHGQSVTRFPLSGYF